MNEDERSLLEDDVDVDSRDEIGKTEVYLAAQNGRLEALRSLVAQGADIRLTDHEGRSPLWAAVNNGHSAVVEYLLKNGADVEKKDRGGNGMTPFALAAYKGHVEVMETLRVEGKAEVNARDAEGKTPFFRAVEEDKLEVVKYLEEVEVNMTHKDAAGLSPMEMALINGCKNVLHHFGYKSLIEIMTEPIDTEGLPLLHFLASKNRVAQLQGLIKMHSEAYFRQYVDLKEPKTGRTALFMAVKKGYMNMVEYLTKYWDADIFTQDNKGQTPILAAFAGQPRVYELLKLRLIKKLAASVREIRNDVINDSLRMGIDLAEIEDEQKNSLFYYLVTYDRLSMVNNLVQKGFGVDSKDLKGRTLLWYAASLGKDLMVKLLVELNAKEQIEEGLKIAEEKNFAAIIETLRKAKNDTVEIKAENKSARVEPAVEVKVAPIKPKITLHEAVQDGNLGRVKKLVEEDRADVLKENDRGQSSVVVAALHDHWEIVDYLLGKMGKKAVDAEDSTGKTLLWNASLRGNAKFVKLLIEHGANVEIGAGQSNARALHMASYQGHLKAVKVLVQVGKANVHHRDSRGCSPLDYACMKDHDDVKHYLMRNGARTETGCSCSIM